MPPRDDYSFSHTNCHDCLRSGVVEDPARIDAMKAVAVFHRRLQDASHRGDLILASALVDEGLALGPKVRDLAWGVLQPLLYRLGDAWARGEVSVAHEHAFTATAGAAVELLFAKDPALQSRRQHREPEVLLVMAEGNHHALGLRLVELALCLQGLTTHTLVPGLPAREVLVLTQALRPRVVGVSVALAPQLDSAHELHRLLAGLPAPTRPRRRRPASSW